MYGEAPFQNRGQVTEQILNEWAICVNITEKGQIFISDIRWPLQRFNQIQLWQLIGTIIGNVHAKIEKKVSISF